MTWPCRAWPKVPPSRRRRSPPGSFPISVIDQPGACGLGLEKRTGSIEVGKEAALIVLSQDLLKTPANEIFKIRVLRGQTVFAQE